MKIESSLKRSIIALALVMLAMLPAALAQTSPQSKAPSKMRGTTIQQRRQAAANAAILRGKSPRRASANIATMSTINTTSTL